MRENSSKGLAKRGDRGYNMSVKVRISYEKSQELHAVLELLRPMMKSYKAEKGGNGPYKRAYVEIETGSEKHQIRR